MLSRYNPVDIEAALRGVQAWPPFPAVTDRAAWEEVRRALGAERYAAIIARAEASAQAPVPSLPATLYLEFLRNGRREGYQQPRAERERMLTSMTLAECLEGKGRFLDAVLDVAWAICEESSWSLPAHQSTLTDMDHHIIDLGVAMTALVLAEMDALLGPALDPLLGKRIRYEVNRRCFEPYLTRHDHWWLFKSEQRDVNNWTAVCNAGVVGAALYLEKDAARLAEMVARAARSMDDYLATFDRDGGSTEGPGYWSYGFGYYTILGQLVEQRTGGKIAFMGEDIVRKAAQFPLRTMLSPHTFVNFSDCDADIRFTAAQLVYLAKRLDLPDLMRMARTQPDDVHRLEWLTWGVRDLLWQAEAEPAGDFEPAKMDWFQEMMWMLARYNPSDRQALALAVKGGHNNEMHNQNDVGNLVVHVNEESLIADIGRGRYNKAYFGPQRYEFFVNSSRGHSVPRPNGQEQQPGQEFAAILLDHRSNAEVDLISLELKGAYPPAADLASLRRTVILQRVAPRGWVELVDEIEFAGQPGMCESCLTTFAAVEVGAGEVVIRGKRGALRVCYDAAVVTPRVEVEKDVDFGIGPADVNCVLFAFKQPRQQGTIRLRIEPV